MFLFIKYLHVSTTSKPFIRTNANFLQLHDLWCNDLKRHSSCFFTFFLRILALFYFCSKNCASVVIKKTYSKQTVTSVYTFCLANFLGTVPGLEGPDGNLVQRGRHGCVNCLITIQTVSVEGGLNPRALPCCAWSETHGRTMRWLGALS